MLIEPMDRPRPPVGGKTVGLGIAAATAAAIFATIAGWEGKENDPYRDIVGVWTVCYGDTASVTPGVRQSDAQCAERLDSQVAAHAAPIIRCVPALRQPSRQNQLVASVSLAYNIGPSGFCRSTAARLFNAGQWRSGCDAFLRWNRAGGRIVRGLTNRRRAEHAICVRGLGA